MSRWHTTEFDLLPEQAFQPRGWKGNMTLEGGGKAPAPDPAIGQAARMQAQLANESFNFYKTTYENDLKPMMLKDLALREELQTRGLGIMDRQQAIADEQWALYKDTYKPVEEKAAQEAMSYDSAENVNRRMGIASANVNQQFSNAQQQNARTLARYGVNPNSSAFARENARLMSDQALAAAGAQTGAAFDTQDRAIALRAGVADRGRGVTGTVGNFLNSGSATGVNTGNTSSQGVSTFQQGTNTMGQGFTTSMQGYNNQANILNQDFQNRLASYNANQAGRNALLGAVGSIGGMMLGAGPTTLAGRMGGAVANKFGFADGGKVEGPGGPRDDKVPAMLSDGEFVLNEGAVKHFGLARLSKMNEVGLKNQQDRGLRG